MIVSQFRVQNRSSTQGPPVAPPRIWGLYLTNLGDKPYQFEFTFYVDSEDPLDETFELDYGGSFNCPLIRLDKSRYMGEYPVHAGRGDTDIVRLVPRPGAPDAAFVGYVGLTIPVVIEVVNYYYLQTAPVSQGEEPVPVLLHPFETSSPNEEARAITLASGKALHEITPEPLLDIWNVFNVSTAEAEAEAGASSSSESRSRDAAVYLRSPSGQTAVSAFLGMAAASTESLAKINDQLARGGHPIRLSKVRRPPPRK